MARGHLGTRPRRGHLGSDLGHLGAWPSWYEAILAHGHTDLGHLGTRPRPSTGTELAANGGAQPRDRPLFVGNNAAARDAQVDAGPLARGRLREAVFKAILFGHLGHRGHGMMPRRRRGMRSAGRTHATGRGVWVASSDRRGRPQVNCA